MWEAARDREIKRHGASAHPSPPDQVFAAMYGHGTIEAQVAAMVASNERALAAADADARDSAQFARMSRSLSDLHPLDKVDFETWCKTSELDRDFVRRNQAAVRRCFNGGGDMKGLPPPQPRPTAYDRYAELGD
jgi:aminoglycoside phosphotransferase (APT) family kinase protein